MSIDLKSLTLSELEGVVEQFGQPRYTAKYIFNFVQAKWVSEIGEITPLSKQFRAKLGDEGYYISSVRLVEKLEDRDGTVKYVFELGDGGRIESVLLFDKGRRTLCVSSQVGCGMGCVFCATGRLGLSRNLTAGEIIEQVIAARREGERVGNVVYMGMGEAFENYEAVLKSVRILNHPAGVGIGIRHITISTCGIVEGIERLGGEEIRPRLAISLNGPSDALRVKLMPAAARHPLSEVLRAVRGYQAKTRQRVSFEYVMIKGVNDSSLHGRMLVKVLRGVMCNVNLIEYNPHEGCGFAGSSKEAIGRFAEILKQAGIETTVRFRMGRGIKAACGQLGSGK